MKKLLLMLFVALLVAGCGQQMTTWMMSGTDIDSSSNEFIGRIGLAKEGIEVGAQSDWLGVRGERQWYGAYAMVDIPIDPNIIGQPYIGYQASLPMDIEDGGQYGPILGTKYPLAENADIVAEGWYRDFASTLKNEFDASSDQWKLVGGLRIRF